MDDNIDDEAVVATIVVYLQTWMKKLINVIIYLYQHTTHPLCLQTAGVRPITSQRFGDTVQEKSDMFYRVAQKK